MMHRFLMVRGRYGALVSDWRNPAARRFLGVERVDQPDGSDFSSRFKPCAQVVPQHPHVTDAIAAGDLEKLAGPVLAESADEAAALMTPKSPAAPARSK